MSKRPKKTRNTKGVGAGIVAFGVTFALYSLLFHPASLGRLLLGLILSGLIATIIRVMGSGLDLTTHNKQDAMPESLEKVSKDTGNPEVDALLQKGREMIGQIRAENKKIPDEGLTGKLQELETLCGDIFRAVYDKPAKASQIRKFMDYYLPTTLKMVKAYRTLGENNVRGAEAEAARNRIDEALGIVIKGCRKLLNNLYQDDMLDITTDIDVLEQMLKRDGLTESDLHLAAEQAKKAAALNDRVEREAAARTSAAPVQEAYDPAQWHTGKTTDVAKQVQSAVEQAQAHAPQAPVLDLGGQAAAQAEQKQE
ncbi:MAG: 5-bromo-4-chloroindolyl phosphate hydrolysis family protein [Eubacteriales bacterium]|nr:5-bromo-4-chloroindolyl phosphate hydrolysis family protein [Eubacteriales bacterium]